MLTFWRCTYFTIKKLRSCIRLEILLWRISGHETGLVGNLLIFGLAFRTVKIAINLWRSIGYCDIVRRGLSFDMMNFGRWSMHGIYIYWNNELFSLSLKIFLSFHVLIEKKVQFLHIKIHKKSIKMKNSL